jgi:F0F1-type ATP synthase membrane subunit b/b'
MSLDEIRQQREQAEAARKQAEAELETVKKERAAAEEGTFKPVTCRLMYPAVTKAAEQRANAEKSLQEAKKKREEAEAELKKAEENRKKAEEEVAKAGTF